MPTAEARRDSRQSVSSRDLRLSSPLVQAFDVVFDNAESIYFAGQKLAGKIVLEFLDSANVNNILIELRGAAKTYWTKDSGQSRKHYRDSEPYFCEQFNTNYTNQYRVGKDYPVLTKGNHEIPFSYRLPENLPSSFEGEFGFVRYTCKVIMERPWEPDLICKRAFTVAGSENLPEEKTGMAEISASGSTLNFSCCRRRGLTKVELTLPKSYYVPGEELQAQMSIVNQGQKAPRSYFLCIQQHSCYYAKDFSGKKHKKVVMREILGDRVPVEEAQELLLVRKLLLPAVPPKLTRCKIIEITYSCNCQVDQKLSLSIPLTVGSITPKKLILNSLVEAVKSSELPQGSQSSVSQYSDQNSWSSKITFKNSIFGEVDIHDGAEKLAFGCSTFVPKYPCLVSSC
uniref:Arrestin C-terminal-like domain-containing protein n=1 Tax=Trichuris muris TaxID=70415 RepID=A0A5S6PZJ7_TRIMR